MEIFHDQVWQMSLGDRAALEGVLSQVKPQLAIEIGTAEGASLQRIAAHSAEVHSFDLVAPSLPVPEHVTLHEGDSHVAVPRVLAELAAQGRNVDFALVDGDHTADGVRRDLEDLLDSPATARTVILVHDVNNEEVRRGLDAVPFGRWEKVVYVHLDCVPGYLFKTERLKYELWGGMGLIATDVGRLEGTPDDPAEQQYFAAAPLFAAVRDVAREHAAPGEDLRAAIERLREEVRIERKARAALEKSVSWRITRPLRTARTRARRLRA